jgi:hypothetical protein
MNSPRIRHLVQPTMSVDDRTVTITNEVRTIMTTTALPMNPGRQAGLELLVSRLAVGMLRWSRHRTDRQHVTHEQMQLLRRVQRETASAADFSRLGRLG